VLHKPLGDDLGHDLVRAVDALATLEPQREGQRIAEVLRVGREEVGVVSGGEKARIDGACSV
jgi:hypothetical protein